MLEIPASQGEVETSENTQVNGKIQTREEKKRHKAAQEVYNKMNRVCPDFSCLIRHVDNIMIENEQPPLDEVTILKYKVDHERGVSFDWSAYYKAEKKATKTGGYTRANT